MAERSCCFCADCRRLFAFLRSPRWRRTKKVLVPNEQRSARGSYQLRSSATLAITRSLLSTAPHLTCHEHVHENQHPCCTPHSRPTTRTPTRGIRQSFSSGGPHDPAYRCPRSGSGTLSHRLLTRRSLCLAQRRIPKPPLFTAASPGRACPCGRRDPDGARRPQGSCLLAEAPASSEPVQPERAPHSPVELITTGQRKIRGPRSALAAAQETKGPKAGPKSQQFSEPPNKVLSR